MKKGILLIPLVLFLIASLSACAAPAPAPAPAPTPAPAPAPAPAPLPTIKWNFQHADPSHQKVEVSGSDAMAKAIADRTDGRFIIRVAIEGELGIPREAYTEALSTGILELCMLDTGKLERTVPHVGIYHLGGLTEDWPKLREELYEMYMEGLTKQGMQMVSPGAWRLVSEQELLAKEPIKNLCDLDGLKVRIWRKGDEALILALKGQPVYMASTEQYMALERGVVGAVNTGTMNMIGNKIYEVAKHFYGIHLPGGMAGCTVNTELFEALPDEYRTILIEEADKALANTRAAMQAEIAEGLKTMEAQEVEIHELSPAERECWREAAQGLWEEWAEQDPSNRKALDIAYELLGY